MSSKKTQKESWFKGLDREFKKIVWPDKMTVAKETAAVVSVSVVRGKIEDAEHKYISNVYGMGYQWLR